jgi:hypothetical protein
MTPMTEHGFLAAMLALVGFEVAVLGLVLGYLTYRISRILERVEGVGAATFLEVRKVLNQPR